MWKSSYIFILLLLLCGCSGQKAVSLQYEAGLYRLAKVVPKKVFDVEIEDLRETEHVGTLLSNRGWKLGSIYIKKFIDDTYKEAIVRDLAKAGFRIEKGCRQKVRVALENLESTFLYESFRPVSSASATIMVTYLYDGQPLFVKKYRGESKDTYFITGEKVAERNAIDSINNALKQAFSDPDLLQTIIE